LQCDPKSVKIAALSQGDCPKFLDSLWLKIIHNSFIDLDKVFSGKFSLESDYKHTETPGDINIVVKSGSGSGKASKSVAMHGDWSLAWGATQDAMAFLYPERKKELGQYQQSNQASCCFQK